MLERAEEESTGKDNWNDDLKCITVLLVNHFHQKFFSEENIKILSSVGIHLKKDEYKCVPLTEKNINWKKISNSPVDVLMENNRSIDGDIVKV